MPAFHHLAIHVRDLAGMVDFYSGLLGLPIVKEWPDPEGGLRSVWLALEPGFLALERASFDPRREEPFEADVGGLLLLAVRIERAERALWEKRLGERGISIERRTAFSLFFRDPEGNRLAVSHHPSGVEDST